MSELAPHRAPFRLIDRVVDAAAGSVRARKLLAAGDPLLAGGVLPDALVIEALAQAAACMHGAAAAAAPPAPAGTEAGEAPTRGMLVAAQDFEFSGRARAGDILELAVTADGDFGQLARVRGEASVDGRVIARGRLTFALEPARSAPPPGAPPSSPEGAA
jgi:3-hydroxyacyl-[acyl-carrier-protein] dehydratase